MKWLSIFLVWLWQLFVPVMLQSSEGKYGWCRQCWSDVRQIVMWIIFLCQPSKERRHIALHMSVGRSVRLYPFCFRSITRELPSSNLDLGSRGTLLILGSLGQRSGSPGQICPNTLSNNFENEFLLHTFVQLILNWLIQLYQTSVTKTVYGA